MRRVSENIRADHPHGNHHANRRGDRAGGSGQDHFGGPAGV